ncbi:MAG: hypothetical protein RSE36_04340 [Oscillospiraceae bacterium]
MGKPAAKISKSQFCALLFLIRVFELLTDGWVRGSLVSGSAYIVMGELIYAAFLCLSLYLLEQLEIFRYLQNKAVTMIMTAIILLNSGRRASMCFYSFLDSKVLFATLLTAFVIFAAGLLYAQKRGFEGNTRFAFLFLFFYIIIYTLLVVGNRSGPRIENLSFMRFPENAFIIARDNILGSAVLPMSLILRPHIAKSAGFSSKACAALAYSTLFCTFHFTLCEMIYGKGMGANTSNSMLMLSETASFSFLQSVDVLSISLLFSLLFTASSLCIFCIRFAIEDKFIFVSNNMAIVLAVALFLLSAIIFRTSLTPDSPVFAILWLLVFVFGTISYFTSQKRVKV